MNDKSQERKRNEAQENRRTEKIACQVVLKVVDGGGKVDNLGSEQAFFLNGGSKFPIFVF
jgi:hypothetical protein